MVAYAFTRQHQTEKRKGREKQLGKSAIYLYINFSYDTSSGT